MGVIGKVGNFYCGTRMCACEGGNPTKNRCPYRCLSAPINHTVPKVRTIEPPSKHLPKIDTESSFRLIYA